MMVRWSQKAIVPIAITANVGVPRRTTAIAEVTGSHQVNPRCCSTQCVDQSEDQIPLPRGSHPIGLHPPAEIPKVRRTEDGPQGEDILGPGVGVEDRQKGRAGNPERIGRRRQDLKRRVGKTHGEQHDGAKGEHHERGEDQHMHHPGAALLGIDHPLLTQSKQNQRLGPDRRVVKSVFLLHPGQDSKSTVHGDAKNRQAGGE